jgi:peroxiredoxin/glutaredoxin
MLKSKENQIVPDIEISLIDNGEWKKIKTKSMFKDKNIIVFSLPGAFTPTCSTSQLPRYEELYDEFLKNGIDEIYVISVNDTFVMNAWKKDQKIKNIKLIPDGNGEFSEQMGMLVNKQDLGFGKRAWRYSMLVRNGVIEKQFIEPEKDGDPFEVSDADTMFKYLTNTEVILNSFTIFTKPLCIHCKKAKQLLVDNNVDFDELIVNETVSVKSFSAITGLKTVPQVYVDGINIGGRQDLEKYFK